MSPFTQEARARAVIPSTLDLSLQLADYQCGRMSRGWLVGHTSHRSYEHLLTPAFFHTRMQGIPKKEN